MRTGFKNSELSALVGKFKVQIIAAAVFSGAINILALAGSMYMLQVYDRVLPSQSVPTLIGLSVLLLLLYAAFGSLDYCRSRLLSRVGRGVDKRIRERVLDAALSGRRNSNDQRSGQQAIRDLDTVCGFASSAGPTALFDLPWMPLYLVLIYFLHPTLGIFATVGGLLLVIITAITEVRARKAVALANAGQTRANAFGFGADGTSDAILAMGMNQSIVSKWLGLRDHGQEHALRMGDITNGMGAVSKSLRMLLQSGILGLGAYLAIQHQLSAGSIIAASIVMSRALAPIEIAIANWKGFAAARQAYARLTELLQAEPNHDRSTSLPMPKQKVEVSGLTLKAPGAAEATVRNVSFALSAGDGLGVIGPSAAGKSTLIKGLIGIWSSADGSPCVRLDGATLDQWSTSERGRIVGYLPQEVSLIEGTIAENIARFDPRATSEEVVAAAKLAGVHEIILKLANGYDTVVEPFGRNLSAGQRQQIGLARALYGSPFLVVLDEPNSNLDANGDANLTTAIKATRDRGGIVIVIAHRPSVLNAVNKILLLANGVVEELGPKDKILKRLMNPQAASAPKAVPPAAVAQLTHT